MASRGGQRQGAHAAERAVRRLLSIQKHCLAGNCQMALIWFRLHRLSRNLRLVNAALKAIDLVKRAQPIHNPNPGLFGGIPGSDPVHGTYIEGAVPNWTAKFFIDTLIEKRRALSELRTEATSPVAGADISRGPIVPGGMSAPVRGINTMMLTSAYSQKVPQMLIAWRGRDIGPIFAARLLDAATSRRREDGGSERQPILAS